MHPPPTTISSSEDSNSFITSLHSLKSRPTSLHQKPTIFHISTKQPPPPIITMKAVASIVCLVLVALCAVEARPKRSIILASPTVLASAPVVASSVVATPVVASHVVHHPTSTVVKTEQVQNADTSSYSYSTEVRSAPAAVVRTAAVAAVPAIATSVVAHTVPTYAAAYPAYAGYGYAYGYPYAYSYGYPYAAAYSPYLLKK